MVWVSDITLPDIFLFIILVGLSYTLLLTAIGLAGGFILSIILAIMRVYGGIELNSFTSGYERLLLALSLN